MKSNHNVLIARNLLVGAGAYYLSKWLVVPLVFGFGKMTQGLIYSGDFNGKIVSQLVWHFPLAVVAFAAGFASRSKSARLLGCVSCDFVWPVRLPWTCVMGAWWAARRFPPNVGATPA
jgi:hypothetical protein